MFDGLCTHVRDCLPANDPAFFPRLCSWEEIELNGIPESDIVINLAGEPIFQGNQVRSRVALVAARDRRTARSLASK